jgi:hypothetical protein
MTEIRVSQFPTVTVQDAGEAPPVVSQFALVTVQDFIPPSIQVSQFAAVMVMGDNGRIARLGDPIGLPCWSPCQNLALRLSQYGE